MKIFVTGGTGFIGSHVVRMLVGQGYQVAVLRRQASSLARCVDFEDKVEWVFHESTDWMRRVVEYKPNVIIHAAWSGISVAERDDWKLQGYSLALVADLLYIAEKSGLAHFIGLGSQAEYGLINGRIDESHPCLPNTAYGASKLAALSLIENYSRQYGVIYNWLRLFSIYGPDEGERWFISNLIRQLRLGHSPQLTGCEQHYDYMHVDDLVAGLLAVLRGKKQSGVFNLSSNTSLSLRRIVELIKEYTESKTELKFGALPYRLGQSMYIEGNSTKFYQAFAFAPQISIERGLREYVNQINFEK